MAHISRIIVVPLASVAFAVVLAGIGGCGSSDKPAAAAPAVKPVEPPPPQPVSLSQIKSELLESKSQVQATSVSLTRLQQSTPADAQANFDAFKREYKQLQTRADAAKARADNLKKKASDYFAMWNKQVEVENPELRRQAAQQKVDAERTYNNIVSEMELTRLSFQPYVANLKDVGNYLNNNLSPGTLKSVGDLVQKATQQSTEVNTHIDAIVASVDKILTNTGEAAAPATRPAA